MRASRALWKWLCSHSISASVAVCASFSASASTLPCISTQATAPSAMSGTQEAITIPRHSRQLSPRGTARTR